MWCVANVSFNESRVAQLCVVTAQLLEHIDSGECLKVGVKLLFFTRIPLLAMKRRPVEMEDSGVI